MLTMTSRASLTILVHEWVTGGGLAGSALPPSWAKRDRAMRRAIAADFAATSGPPVVRVIVTLDSRLPADPGPWTWSGSPRVKQPSVYGSSLRRLILPC